MYLLGHPDYYTDCNFNICYWKSYVAEVTRYFGSSELENQDSVDISIPEKIVISSSSKGVVGFLETGARLLFRFAMILEKTWALD